MSVALSFRIWSNDTHVPDIAELAARQESVTGLACTFGVHRASRAGWEEVSVVPVASRATACTLTRSTDPAIVAQLMRALRPTRSELVHELRLARTVYFAGTGAGRTDITLLMQFGLTWALAQVTRGLIAG